LKDILSFVIGCEIPFRQHNAKTSPKVAFRKATIAKEYLTGIIFSIAEVLTLKDNSINNNHGSHKHVMTHATITSLSLVPAIDTTLFSSELCDRNL
jgi:hypothetical protein